MPIYEFLCKDCRSIFEQLCFSSRDVETVRCPRCGSKKVSKLLSTFSSRSSGGFGGFGSGFGSSCTGSRFS
ncbi:MAG: zinc ribbon domain-containing protein [Thermodesulfobacteria bacterium]|nr:zinc ribbon domain-containing protein [Thermodesulfobacteriota bacterium]